MLVVLGMTTRVMLFAWGFESGLGSLDWNWIPSGLGSWWTCFWLEEDISIPASLEAQIDSSILCNHADFLLWASDGTKDRSSDGTNCWTIEA